MPKGLNSEEKKKWQEVKSVLARHGYSQKELCSQLGKNSQFLYQDTGRRYLIRLMGVIDDFPELFNPETAKLVNNV